MTISTSEFSVEGLELNPEIFDLEPSKFVEEAERYTMALLACLTTSRSVGALEENIKEQAYYTLDSTFTPDDLNSAAEAFKRFAELPYKTREKIKSIVPGRKEYDIGHIIRKREGAERGKTDNKQYFHYNLYVEKILSEYINEIPELREFIKYARKVYLHATAQFIYTLKLLEQKYHGISKYFLRDGEPPHFFLRFLSYDVNDENVVDGDFSAKAHYDRSAITIALGESHPGLRIGADEDNLKELIHEPGKSRFFLSMKRPEIIIRHYPETLSDKQREMLNDPSRKEELIRSINTDLPLGFHDVIQKSDSSRWAIVCFFSPYDPIDVSYEATHTPMN